jgi:hypothetical protein
MQNQSEVALMRERIDREVEALQRLRYGFAKVADHETIMNHYRALDVCYLKLAAQIGEEKATDLVCERINTIQ